nr:MAG TPA: hypothetical protein [Caudoviricetes sp.]
MTTDTAEIFYTVLLYSSSFYFFGKYNLVRPQV